MAEEERAALNDEIERLLAEGGHDERVAQLADRMEALLGQGEAGVAGQLLRPVSCGGLLFRQRPGSDAEQLGWSVWRGALSLGEYLVANALLVRGKRVVELGCGAGVAGCVAASLGATSVLLTDLPSVVSLAQENARLNGLEAAVAVAPLRWGEVEAVPPAADVVLGAELVARLYDGTALLATLWWLGAPALLSFQRHDPLSAASFLRQAVEEGFAVKLLQQREGVEIVRLFKAPLL